MRVGIGYDSHKFVPGRPLILGGQTIPFDKGLAGHSDADAVTHALTDAILGAAAAGNIGSLFPDSDARWQGADSLELLRAAYHEVEARGFVFHQADITVILERPKIGPTPPPWLRRWLKWWERNPGRYPSRQKPMRAWASSAGARVWR